MRGSNMLEADEITAGSAGARARRVCLMSSRWVRLTVVCLFGLVAGCASPAAQLAKYKTDRELEEALVDDTFPNAAEVGLAVSN
ncbi:MAG TPA: hypothetical protein VL175_11315 [Pirellulales bacterium]|jgi:hypothetical protein|nr:hypothetical protein [Pirellulales bacterium]